MAISSVFALCSKSVCYRSTRLERQLFYPSKQIECFDSSYTVEWLGLLGERICPWNRFRGWNFFGWSLKTACLILRPLDLQGDDLRTRYWLIHGSVAEKLFSYYFCSATLCQHVFFTPQEGDPVERKASRNSIEWGHNLYPCYPRSTLRGYAYRGGSYI